MRRIQKKNFPDMTMTCNLFLMQLLQPGERHLELLKRVMTAVELGSVGTREEFLLDYNQLVVIIAISSFPKHFQKGIAVKFNS